MTKIKKLQLILQLFSLWTLIAGSLDSSPSRNQLANWASAHTRETSPLATTNGGVPMPSLTASQAIGSRGHILLQDAFLLEELANFNRERIPERVVHAKGVGAFGEFKVTHDITHITKAKFLSEIGKITNVVVRISTVGGESGSADTAIDPKGFATKFYTEDGVYDLVGNNIEVFPIRDPMLFSDINRARKRNPQTHLADPNMWWDFTSLRPESTLHTLHLFSDEGRPDGVRRMDGAGVHTFKMVNSSGNPVYVKFHWLTKQTKKSLTRIESAKLTGENPDYAVQDMFDAIERKDFPSWDLNIQVMTFDQAKSHPQNPFDITKHWRRDQYPLIPVGRMTLNKNPTDYFTQIEQVAFSPANLVPGIEPSPDRMLHARMFAYADAQRYRLGVNFAQIPVNRCPFEVTSYNRDGAMNVDLNGRGGPNYFPNSYHGTKESPSAAQSKFSVRGEVDRVDTGDDDNFSLGRIYLKNDISSDERKRIIDNIADFLSKADNQVQKQFLMNIAYPLDIEFGDSLKAALIKAKRTRVVNLHAKETSGEEKLQ